MRRRPLVAFLLLTVASLAASDDSGRRWWSHVEYLASDQLEGRLTGSVSHRKAAEYVAEQFKKGGLVPAGIQGYVQPVGFYSRTIVEKDSNLAIIQKGHAEALQMAEEVILSARIRPAKTLSAPLTFVGYGLTVPEYQYDDLKGLDLKGKVAVYLNGGPSSIPGALRAHYSSLEERWKSLKRAGAVGVLAIPDPHHMDIPWERIMVLRTQPAMTLADPKLEETPGEKFAAFFNPAHAEQLFAGTGHFFGELVTLADAGKPLPTFPLAASLNAKAAFEEKSVVSQNLVGVLRGTDPNLKSEYVVLSAHLDHLGVGEPIRGDRIYNGAMDNAAGVATILDVAAMLHESNAKPRRSILFVAFTGEEKGLLGSRYFVAHPTVPLRSMVGNLNVDMFLPIIPLKILTVLGLNDSSLGPALRSVVEPLGVTIQDDPEPARNIFIRSDQYNFVRAGIPAIYFKVGAAPGSPEAATEKRWLTDRYHAPSDDTHQPVDFGAAAKYNQIVLRLIQAMADQPARPAWNQDSFFRRYAKAEPKVLSAP